MSLAGKFPGNGDQTLNTLMDTVFKRYSNLPALRDCKRPALSFADLQSHAGKKVRIMNELGICQDLPVAIWLDSRPDLLLWVTSLARYWPVVPLSSSIRPNQARALFDTVKPRVLVTDGSHPEAWNESLSQNRIGTVTVRREHEDSWSFLVDVVADGLKGMPATVQNLVPPGDKDIALYLVTSGTTSQPKVVPVLHQALAITTRRSCKQLRIEPGDIILNVMALNHVHGLVSNTFMPWLAGACCVCLDQTYSARQFLKHYSEVRPNWFSVSPEILADLMRSAGIHGYSLENEHLRFIRVGSSHLSKSLEQEAISFFGVPLIQVYGMSETLQIAGNPIDKPVEGSVGLPIVDDVRIVDTDGVVQPHDEIGEIQLYGRTVFPGYANPEMNQERAGGWFSTGDLGHQDALGYLFVQGRIDERLNLGGEATSIPEIRNALLELNEVSECVVVNEDTTNSKPALLAFVVLTEGSDCTAEQIRERALTVLARAKVPGRIRIVTGIPLTFSGKPDIDAIRSLFSQEPTQDSSTPLQCDVERWLSTKIAMLLDLSEKTLFRESHFFELGASSLDAAELALIIEDKLHKPFHIIETYRNPTIEQLAMALKQNYADEIGRVFGLKVAPLQTPRRDNSQPPASPTYVADTMPLLEQSFERSPASPVFVLSAPRTGSTLLRVMLAGSSYLFAPPELRLLHFASMGEWSESYSENFAFFRNGVIQSLMTARQCRRDEAEQYLARLTDADEPVQSVYEVLQRDSDRIVVDKSPLYAYDPSILRSLTQRFTDPKFIILYRNPEEAIQSYVDARMSQIWMKPWHGDDRSLAEHIWQTCYKNIEAFTSQLPVKSFVSLRFEDLIESPEETLERVSLFLQIPYESAMCRGIYSRLDQRMAEPTTDLGKPLGDPNFLNHTSIDRTKAGYGRHIPDSARLETETLRLASHAGYKNAFLPAPGNDILTRQRSMTEDWGDRATQLDSLFFGLNLEGSKPPLVWIFQTIDEAVRLARALGEDQPLLFSRSGNMLVSKHDMEIASLAKHYAEKLIQHYPSGELVIGGNCQGAYVAREIVREFSLRGRTTATVFVMEAHFETPLDVNAVHIFSTESRFNPESWNPNTVKLRDSLFRSSSTHILDCQHGQFFQPGNLPSLVKVIRGFLP